MAVTLSAGLQALIDAAPKTKTAYAGALRDGLGNTRRLILSKDGTVFLNVGMTGAMTASGSGITGFGAASGVTVRAAADLLNGGGILRIEGNGNWYQATIGLSKAAQMAAGVLEANVAIFDYYLPSNPTATSGYGFALGAQIKSPIFYASGTGPTSPANVDSTPASVTIEDWSSGSAVVAGVIAFNTRAPDFVFDDAELAASMGDVRILKSTQSVVLDDIEFGAIMWGINASISTAGTEPVYEVLILQKPTDANWPGWPAYQYYNALVSNTFAKPFKAVIKNAAGTVLYTHQMRDGLPINSPALGPNTHLSIKDQPLRPFLHCAAALPWRSSKPKLNTYAAKYYPGCTSEGMAPQISRHHYVYNPPEPMISGGFQINGIGGPYNNPKWPIVATQTAVNALSASSQDAYLYTITNIYAPWGDNGSGGATVNQGVSGMIGWGYEPGSRSSIDQLCGFGGTRQDRYVISWVYASFMTDQTYARPFNNDPIAEMVDHWSRAMYNLPNFFVSDVKNGTTIPMNEVFNNEWSMGGGYYDVNASYTAGGAAKSIFRFSNWQGFTNDSAKPYFGAYVDKNGRMPFNGASTDYLHNWWNYAWDVFLLNSPMAAYASKHRYISSITCQAGWIREDSDTHDWFLTRQHAERWLHHVNAWKMSSDHELGIAREPIAQRFENECNAIHAQIYTDASKATPADWRHQALKLLGAPCGYNAVGTPEMRSHSMTFYMGHVLQLMKVNGMWDAMLNRSQKCNDVLMFIIRCMDLYSIDWILDTHGVTDAYVNPWTGTPGQAGFDLATSWADWLARMRPRNGQEDWVTRADGTLKRDQDYGTQHLRAQYVFIRRDYFPEIASVRANGVALAATKFQGYYDKVTAAVSAASDNNAKRDASWLYLTPNNAPIKPPVA